VSRLSVTRRLLSIKSVMGIGPSTHHSVVHKVHARQLEFLLASVETVDGVVTVGCVGRENEAGQLTTQVLCWSTASTCVHTAS